MKGNRLHIIEVILWSCVAYLAFHVPLIEMRLDDEQAHKYSREQTPESTEAPAPPKPKHMEDSSKCFHMPRSSCPRGPARCVAVDPVSVFCCDIDSAYLRDGLHNFMMQNTTRLHVLNSSLEELDVSLPVFRRLISMSFTDGNIGKIVGKFLRHSSVACLNISNNNLTTAKLQPSKQRPFAYLYNLTTLDASANNLTEFPLSLVHSNRKISVDFSGNNYLPCKHFQMVMESTNSSLVTFESYNKTYCALDLQFNWFKDVQFVQLEYLKVQKELNDRCQEIRPPNINCTCVPDRLQILGNGVTNVVAVDCSNRHLKEMPTNLPNNTVKLNVSYNNITSLLAVDKPSYSQLRQLIVDHNDITDIDDLEGSKFIDNFMLFSICHNKLKTIHPHVFSNKFDNIILSGYEFTTISIGGNYIHCDCNTEKVLKPWLLENLRNIPDYASLKCEDGVRAVVELVESQVCHAARDWTDYINYIIGLEVLVLAALVGKVSYDYRMFKSTGYLPWPANKLPRLPCDWLCE